MRTAGPRYHLLDADSIRMNGIIDLVKDMAARKQDDLARHDQAIDRLVNEILEACQSQLYVGQESIASRNLAGLKAYFSSLEISYQEDDFDFGSNDGTHHKYDGILAATYRVRAIYSKWRTQRVNEIAREVEDLVLRYVEGKAT